MFAQSLLVPLLVASSALAHYTLDYPPSRGFVDEDEVKFCGGFSSPSSMRTPFPLTGNGPGEQSVSSFGTYELADSFSLLPIVQWDSHHAIGTVGIYVSTSENPTNWSDFSSTMAKNWFTGPNGAACTNIDMSQLNMNLTNGSLVTIQMVANGGDGNLYQCADLILLEGYTAPSNETCSNDVSLASNATATATPSLGQSASATSTGASMTMGSATGAAASASASPTSGAFRGEVVGAFLAFAMAAAGLSVAL
ncbi:hypothetical protein NliqN6_5655 [Naganishia liquefaciens]|uniref:Copper acquisition factor BIM1-like domain-containing protein n=1 Tax=Naganishia liquefaciens TaxID=104408 RepID=A0A8H3TYN8_9TREE|nr:hypothetical protein NliqN6_5655 [Naganishia liquefaciens]